MTTPIAELTVETVAVFVGIVGSSIIRSVGAVTYPARSDRFGTQVFPGGDLKQETPRSEVKNKN